jgi:hypothetical protein
MTDRIEKLEAQVNALAQALLRLAAVAEVQGQFQPEQLRDLRWPGQPYEAEAVRTMGWLCDELSAAREARQLSGQAG